ncbi:sigma-54-dependent transcriptional regulator [Candidatus Magnetominusculus dajiuhuensis]|uniref:sigma-54-dependent transcriptional regulator n=1 Tax=Candidatus Magnetominusculus dajiuhuensis TaxID=3137712 RepID=UPI003B43B5F7
MYKVIVAESEYSTRNALKSFLELNSYSVVEAPGGALAIEYFKECLPDAVILDLKLSDIGGSEVLLKMMEVSSETPVILLAGHGEIDMAIEALGDGAYDYFPKPPDIERLMFVLTRCIEANLALKKTKQTVNSMLEWHLGTGESMKQVIRDIEMAADSGVSVFIQGENGTGKSLIARLIHFSGTMARGPFIQFDAETALKGNKDMSARLSKLFKQAAGGTIYFKGLHMIPPAASANLISELTADNGPEQEVRIIATGKTHAKDPFLFIDWFVIRVPSLYERIEDVPFLAGKFVAETADELNVTVRDITKEAIKILSDYTWPGNTRELKSAVRQAMILADGPLLRAEHFYFLQTVNTAIPSISLKDEKARAVKDTERKAIVNALEASNNRKTAAAKKLGISRKTLWEKIREYNIEE